MPTTNQLKDRKNRASASRKATKSSDPSKSNYSNRAMELSDVFAAKGTSKTRSAPSRAVASLSPASSYTIKGKTGTQSGKSAKRKSR